MNSRSVGIFAVVVAIVIGVSLYYLNSDRAPHVPPPADVVIAPPKATPTPAPAIAQATKPDPATPKPAVPMPPPPVAVTPPPQITEDDTKIDNILRLYPGNSDEDNTKTAQALINLLPTLTSDGQTECISHIGNLLSDEEWKRLMPVWKNPSVNPDVLESIYTDLMNRDDKVKLPALVEAVRLPNHPSYEEAKSTLEIFLDEDYGNDVAKWDKAVKAYLKKQAEEEAGTAPN